jgi:polysaccharide biosynthesis protein PslG
VGKSRRRGYRRAFLTTAMAVVVGLVCTTTISKDLVQNRRPRDVFVTATATINPAPTTTAIAASDVYGMTQAHVDKTMDMLRASSVTSVRLMIPWAGVEPTQGSLNWSTVDKTVNSAASRKWSAWSTRRRGGRWRAAGHT